MGEGARSVTRQASAGVAAGGESKGRGGARECLPVNARPHKARKVGAEMKGANAPLIAQSVKNPPAMQETLGQFLGGRSPGEGIGYALQCPGLENPMDCIVHGVTESDTTERLSLSLSFQGDKEGSLWVSGQGTRTPVQGLPSLPSRTF